MLVNLSYFRSKGFCFVFALMNHVNILKFKLIITQKFNWFVLMLKI